MLYNQKKKPHNAAEHSFYAYVALVYNWLISMWNLQYCETSHLNARVIFVWGKTYWANNK